MKKARFIFSFITIFVISALLITGTALADFDFTVTKPDEPFQGGVLDGLPYLIVETDNGLTFPQFTYGDSADSLYADKDYGNICTKIFFPNGVLLTEDTIDWAGSQITENSEVAMRAYNSWNCYALADAVGDLEPLEEEKTQIDGHVALLRLYDFRDYTGAVHRMGHICYTRNNRLYSICIYSGDIGESSSPEDSVTMDDLRMILSHISYDKTKAQITQDDGTFSLSIKNDQKVVSAGKKLQISAQFDHPERITGKVLSSHFVFYEGHKIKWSVIDPKTGEAPENITINARGNLSSSNRIKDVTEVEVWAESQIFHTKASCSVTVIPAARQIVAEPSELIFYLGTNTPQTVKVSFAPDTVPPLGLEWTVQKKGIVELESLEAGSATVSPVSAGKTTITVREPGGKSARVTVNVIAPVEDIDLSVSVKCIPGGTVQIKQSLLPKEAGNKALEWSLDVSDDIATITSKGQVKISRTAAPGTKITVTCKALGAPVPIEKTIQIEVAEK